MLSFNEIGDRAREVLAHLPEGTFTVEEFLGHATGLNVVSNANEVSAMVAHLIGTEAIRRIDGPTGQPQRWVRCFQQGRR